MVDTITTNTPFVSAPQTDRAFNRQLELKQLMLGDDLPAAPTAAPYQTPAQTYQVSNMATGQNDADSGEDDCPTLWDKAKPYMPSIALGLAGVAFYGAHENYDNLANHRQNVADAMTAKGNHLAAATHQSFADKYNKRADQTLLGAGLLSGFAIGTTICISSKK